MCPTPWIRSWSRTATVPDRSVRRESARAGCCPSLRPWPTRCRAPSACASRTCRSRRRKSGARSRPKPRLKRNLRLTRESLKTSRAPWMRGGSRRSQLQNLAALFAGGKRRIGFQRAGGAVHRIAGIVETHFGLVKIVAALLAGPDEPVYFFFAALPLDHVSPGALGAPRRVRRVLGQKKNIAGLKRCQLALAVLEVVKLELALELVKNLIAGIDMKILAPVGAAGDKRD